MKPLKQKFSSPGMRQNFFVVICWPKKFGRSHLRLNFTSAKRPFSSMKWNVMTFGIVKARWKRVGRLWHFDIFHGTIPLSWSCTYIRYLSCELLLFWRTQISLFDKPKFPESVLFPNKKWIRNPRILLMRMYSAILEKRRIMAKILRWKKKLLVTINSE